MNFELTEDKLRSILDEYLAPQEKRQRLKPNDIKRIAAKLNEKINVPFVSEEKEGRVLSKIVLEVDTFLYDNLPNELYDLVWSLEDGIDEDESKRLINRFTNLANNLIDIPYIPELLEGVAIKLIITWIFKAMRKHFDLEKAESEININAFA